LSANTKYLYLLMTIHCDYCVYVNLFAAIVIQCTKCSCRWNFI